jgi:hypothetical protein
MSFSVKALVRRLKDGVFNRCKFNPENGGESQIKETIRSFRRMHELRAEWLDLGIERRFSSASPSTPAFARSAISAARTAWTTLRYSLVKHEIRADQI